MADLFSLFKYVIVFSKGSVVQHVVDLAAVLEIHQRN